jgi:Carboxypeptidase regulatory-like domain/Secretin and TonB N terminus short domain
MRFTYPANGKILTGILTNYKRALMRLTLIIVFFCTGLQLLMAGSTRAQALADVKVVLELKDGLLKTAFRKIEEQTPFRFAYNKMEVDNQHTLALQKAEYTVKNVLDLLLANTPLSFRQVNNKIIIVSTDNNNGVNNLPNNMNTSLFEGSLRGKVTDEKDVPVAGASIVIKGSKGTAADANGMFVLSGIQAGKYKVEISALGFQSVTRDITITDGAAIERSNCNRLFETI